MNLIKGLLYPFRKNTIFMVIDHLNKLVHFISINHLYTAMDITQIFMDNVYKLHGMPQTIIWDPNILKRSMSSPRYQVQHEFFMSSSNERSNNLEGTSCSDKEHSNMVIVSTSMHFVVIFALMLPLHKLLKILILKRHKNQKKKNKSIQGIGGSAEVKCHA